MKYLLDTHVFIWLDTQPEKLSKKAMQLCENKQNTLYLSSVSIWEMQIKKQLGKLDLKLSLDEMVETQQKENDLQILTITSPHIYKLQDLPFIHNDPFDRLLLAQSLLEEMPLISIDEKIMKYDATVIW